MARDVLAFGLFHQLSHPSAAGWLPETPEGSPVRRAPETVEGNARCLRKFRQTLRVSVLLLVCPAEDQARERKIRVHIQHVTLFDIEGSICAPDHGRSKQVGMENDFQ